MTTGRSPKKLSTLFATTQTSRHVVYTTLRLLALISNTIYIVKRQLLALGDLLDGKQGQVVDVLISVVAHARKDAHVWVTRVINKASWAGHKFAVNFQRWPFQTGIEGIGVGELVESKEVDVFPLRNRRGGAATICLSGGDDLADVSVDELSFFNRDGTPHAPSSISGSEDLERDSTAALYNAVGAVDAAGTALVAFVDGHL